MDEGAFRRWLATGLTASGQVRSSATVRNRMTNCRKVEEFEGSLDQHFDTDRMAALLSRLEYTIEDQRKGAPSLHRIPVTGDLRNGTATLRSAVSLYLRFREASEGGARPQANESPPKAMAPRRRLGGTSKWPGWSVPTDEEVLALAHVVARYARFLEPGIIASLVEDNEHHRTAWSGALRARGVDPGLFLWERSPCAFPGVRRHAGGTEIAQFRGRATSGPLVDAIKIDDNTYPKHIWSFIFRGRAFQQSGPEAYALAHLADHKIHGGRREDEIVYADPGGRQRGWFGLYTSAANTTYVPTALARPTDFAAKLRNLLQRRALALYQNCCALLPPGQQFALSAATEWQLDAFEWAAPVGDSTHVQTFLEFRAQELEHLLSTVAPL